MRPIMSRQFSPSLIKKCAIACLLLPLSLMTGCASLPDTQQIEQSAAINAGKSKKQLTSVMQKAKVDIKKGETETLSFYAPSYMEHAYQSLAKAEEQQKAGDKQEAKRYAIQTSKYINAGTGVKKTVSTTLKKALKHREILTTLKASEHYPEAHQAVEKGFLELVQMIEQQEVNQAREQQTQLIEQMRALEVKAVSYIHLSQAEEIYEQAMVLGAAKLAPTTLVETDQVLDNARQLISQNPKDKPRILKQAKASTFAAERLYHITRLAKRYAVAEESQTEALLLDHEKGLSRVQSALKIEDIRNLSFNDQSLVLEERSKEVRAIAKGELVKSNRRITKAELDKWRRKVVLLQSEVRRLQRALEEK